MTRLETMSSSFLAKDRNRILIVGGGYLGYHVAQGLQKRIKESGGIVTIVDPNPYMMYLPFLPEVAAGSLEARSAVAPFQQFLKDTESLSGRVIGIDHDKRVATVASINDGPVFEVPYDEIVLAAGSVTRAFPIPGLGESAIGMKSIEEAVAVRNWVFERISAASQMEDGPERRKALTFVLVGGGFAGVETIGELEDAARRAAERNPRVKVSDLRFVLVEAAGRIMPEVSQDRAEKVVAELRSRGVEVLLNTSLESAEDDHIKLINMQDKSPAGEFDADTLIWTAGVQANPLFKKNTPFPVDDRGRVRAGADLRVTGDDGPIPGAWTGGDNAAVPDLSGQGPGGFCVPNAQHAIRQAKVMVKNILASREGKPLEDYYHESLGTVAGLGLFKGAANVKGIEFSGPLAWLMHRGYHAYAMPTLDRKFRILSEWTANMVFGRNTTQIRHVRDPRLNFETATGQEVVRKQARL